MSNLIEIVNQHQFKRNKLSREIFFSKLFVRSSLVYYVNTWSTHLKIWVKGWTPVWRIICIYIYIMYKSVYRYSEIGLTTLCTDFRRPWPFWYQFFSGRAVKLGLLGPEILPVKSVLKFLRAGPAPEKTSLT